MNLTDIRPFIPAIDLEASKMFYEAIGFLSSDATDELTIMSNGNCAFFLYKHDQAELENNLMFQLTVPNIDEVLESIEMARDLNFKYEGIKEERWGKVIYMWGPCGEMWHITEHFR